jgi:hypothetical protein
VVGYVVGMYLSYYPANLEQLCCSFACSVYRRDLLTSSLMYLVPLLARYAGIAEPLPCHGFFCEFILRVWALKAHCAVCEFCVKEFVHVDGIAFIFNSFCCVALLIRYFHDRTLLPLFCNVLSDLFF